MCRGRSRASRFPRRKRYGYTVTHHYCTTTKVPWSTRVRGAISCSREEGWKKACSRCCCCCRCAGQQSPPKSNSDLSAISPRLDGPFPFLTARLLCLSSLRGWQESLACFAARHQTSRGLVVGVTDCRVWSWMEQGRNCTPVW